MFLDAEPEQHLLDASDQAVLLAVGGRGHVCRRQANRHLQQRLGRQMPGAIIRFYFWIFFYSLSGIILDTLAVFFLPAVA